MPDRHVPRGRRTDRLADQRCRRPEVTGSEVEDVVLQRVGDRQDIFLRLVVDSVLTEHREDVVQGGDELDLVDVHPAVGVAHGSAGIGALAAGPGFQKGA